MADDVLLVKGAKKRFAAVVALDGAELSLRAGEILGLLGPNGAGKTTLVRAISGRVALDEGRMTAFGAPLEASTPRTHFGFVPQELAIYTELTAAENLEAFGRFHGLGAADARERSMKALEWTGLSDRAQSKVKTFSGGMKRRLNIACGVLHRPRILVLDEPTVAVDPQSREKIYDMLAALVKDGTAVLLTTHHLEEAEVRCDRIVIIDKGKTVAAGTVEELAKSTIGTRRRVTLRLRREIAAPPSPFVAGATPRHLVTHVDDPAAELGGVLDRLKQCGLEVDDLDVRGPSLQAVFLHLTGSELRE